MAGMVGLPANATAGPITALEFDPGGNALFVAQQRRVHILSVATGKLEHALELDYPKVNGLAVSPVHPELLAIAGGTPGSDGGVTVFNWRRQKRLLQHEPFSDLATGVEFSPDGNRLAASSADQTVQVWTVTEQGEATLSAPYVDR